MRRLLLAATLLTPFAAQAQVVGGNALVLPSGCGSAAWPSGSAPLTVNPAGQLCTSVANTTVVTPTGATTAQTLADLAAQQGVLLDAFKQAGDADDTASFTRAMAAGVPILLGPKTYSVHDLASGAVSSLVIKGVPGRSILQRTSATGGNFFSITATNVVIDGVTFDMNSGSVSANQWGVRLTGGGQNVRVTNSVFENNSGSIGACFTLSGTGLSGGGSFTFAGNEVTNCTLQAVYFNSVSNGVVADNHVHDVSGFGIFVGGTGATPSTDIILDRNRVLRSGSTGISVGGTSSPFAFGSPQAIRVQVTNNLLQDNPTYGVSLEGDYCDAIGNQVDQSSGSVSILGAIDTYGRYGKILNNTINFSGVNFAIDIGGSQYMLVQGNHVTMNQGAAYNTGGNLNTSIRENVAVLSGTAYGVTNYATEGSGGGGTFPTQTSGTVIENNTFNMSGSSTTGVAIFDNAGGYPNTTATVIQRNNFNVSGSGVGPNQAIYWRGGPHSLVIDGNLYNGSNYTFADPASSGADLIIDWVSLGGTVQGAGSTNTIRSIAPRDLETYGGGGSVLWITPTAGGSGYTAATVINISGTGCSGVTAAPRINNGVIVGVHMTAVGSGCSGTVTASASDTGGGSGATFSVGTKPVLPDRATLRYLPAATVLLQASGGYNSLLPGVPVQMGTNSGALTLQAFYSGGYWEVVSVPPASFTVSGLPTCNSAANKASVIVTDASSPTFGGSLTGGGAVIIHAFCNGSSWLAN